MRIVHQARQVLLALTLAALAGCASTPIAVRPPHDGANDAARQLNALLADSDEAFLRRNPIWALYRGDPRFAAEFGDFLSDAYVAAERNAATEDLRRLAALDCTQLDSTGRAICDTFEWQRRTALRRHERELAATWLPLQLNHFDGWHMYFPDLSSGEGVAPYKAVADYDNGLARIDGFIAYLDQALTRAREGAARGGVQPRIVIERLIEQFDRFATHSLADSPYYGPIRKWPANLPAADQQRLREAYATAIRDRLVPAFVRIRDGLRKDVLPHTRASVGLSQMPGGAAYYRFLIEERTTSAMAPQAIHELGLAEVARLSAAMDSIRQRVGFAGSRAQFFEYLRTDQRFKPTSAQALRDGYFAIGHRVDAVLPKLFAVRPRTALEIRPTPDYQAPTDAAASYTMGTPDGVRPGLFYFNTYDLPSRTTPGMETLYLHEALPGHHMQIMLAAENTALPKFMRFGGNTAYDEGWALYAESLGAELGLFTDPIQHFGHLNDEMWRALRLVIDTGLHAFGWTREQAIVYMLENSSASRTDAVAEVERYIAWPAQALAYKIGQLTIRRLRTKAEQSLGPRFDIREFHAHVLMTGSLPMPVLERKIDAWIADGLRR